MYCDPSRPLVKEYATACVLAHIGDGIFGVQKWIGLPDWLGLVAAPYFPVFNISHTGTLIFLVPLLLFATSPENTKTWREFFKRIAKTALRILFSVFIFHSMVYCSSCFLPSMANVVSSSGLARWYSGYGCLPTSPTSFVVGMEKYGTRRIYATSLTEEHFGNDGSYAKLFSNEPFRAP